MRGENRRVVDFNLFDSQNVKFYQVDDTLTPQFPQNFASDGSLLLHAVHMGRRTEVFTPQLEQ